MISLSQWQELWRQQQVYAKNISGGESKSKDTCRYHFAHRYSSPKGIEEVSQLSWKNAALVENL